MKHRLMMLAVTLSAVTLESSAFAHHSHVTFYDGCRSLTLEGRVDRVEFRDPHTLVFLTLDDGTAYTVDWAGLRGLTNQRIIDAAREVLVSGTRIVVTGHPIRTLAGIRAYFPDYNGTVNPNTIDPMSIRAGDRFSWAPPSGGSLPCVRK